MTRMLIIGLPGVPAAALTAFAVLIRPALLRLAGWPAQTDPGRTSARLGAPCTSVLGREDHVHVRLEMRDQCLWAQPLQRRPSSLFALTAADGVAIIPAHAAELAAGDLVQVVRF